jgi:hypothetical protein
MGHGAWGIGNGELGMGNGELGIGHRTWGNASPLYQGCFILRETMLL